MILLFSIINNTISITKGDSAQFKVRIKNPGTGEDYRLQPGDRVVLSVKPDKKDAQYLFQIDGPVFHILPEHTIDANPRQRYYYDVELRFGNNQDVHTIVKKSLFVVKEEITDDW